MQLILVLASVLVLGLANATCPAFDKPPCATRGGDLDEKACDTEYVPKLCPYLCGICKEDDKERPTCDEAPECHKSAYGCIWNTPRATAEFCSDKTDSSACASNGGEFGCDSCYRLGNAKEYCPFMCGYC